MTPAVMNLTREEHDYYLMLADKMIKAKRRRGGYFNPEEMEMTHHAFEKAKERFGLGRERADKYFKFLMTKSTYICQTVDEIGFRTHTFGVYIGDGYSAAIHVSLNRKYIHTVIKYNAPNYPMPEKLKNKAVKLCRSELDKLLDKEERYIEKGKSQEEIREVQDQIRYLARSMITTLL